MVRTVTPRRGAAAVAPKAAEDFPVAPALYRTKNDLPEPDRVEAVTLLNQRLADCIALQTQMDDLNDADSADILTEVSRGIDKWLWFVEAHEQEPTSGVGRPGRRE